MSGVRKLQLKMEVLRALNQVSPMAMVEMRTGSWSMALPGSNGGRWTGAGPCQNDDWVAR